MATGKRAPRRRKTPARKKQKWHERVNWRIIVYAVSLAFLLVFTIGMLFYVVFFRVAVAAETEVGADSILFEEPSSPVFVEDGEKRANQVFEPRVAILIDDMGYHREIGKKMILLPHTLSFSFLPKAPHTEELERLAYRRGRTVLLHLPLEAVDPAWDPGPGALHVHELPMQKEIFLENLALVPHAVGVNNHMGSRYTRNRGAMEPLLRLIKDRDLFFLDSYTTSKSIGYTVAKEIGLATAKRRVFLDNVAEVEAICAQLRALAETAVMEGEAIGIGHPHAETLTALQTCLGGLADEVEIAGIEELVR